GCAPITIPITAPLCGTPPCFTAFWSAHKKRVALTSSPAILEAPRHKKFADIHEERSLLCGREHGKQPVAVCHKPKSLVLHVIDNARIGEFRNCRPDVSRRELAPVLQEIETLFSREDHNQGLFSFPEIRTLILAALLGRCQKIDEIVLDLERNAGIEPELVESLHLLLVPACKGTADCCRCRVEH